MTAQVIPFRRPRERSSADRAWRRYAAHRLQEMDRPELADDPGHKATAERLHTEWETLFLAEEEEGDSAA